MTIWTPAAITTSLWLDASDNSTLTLESGVVSQWRDKSGNARHYAQSSASLRPSVSSADLNGRDVVRFASGKTLSSAYNLSASPFSYYLVLQRETTGNITPLIDSTSAYSYLHYSNDWYIGGGLKSVPMTAGLYYLHGAIVQSNNSAQRRQNGANVSTTSSATGFGTYNIGGTFSAVAFRIAELLLFASALSSDDQHKIEGYLAHKWGLAGSLPNDHPYKNAAPAITDSMPALYKPIINISAVTIARLGL